MMKSTKSSALLLLPAIGLLACISAPLRAADDSEIVAQRSQVREMSGDMLATLYEYQPAARFAIEHSAGYGVFSTFGIKLLFAGGQSGKGIVHNMRTGRDTFMKMIGAQAGLGFGVSRTTVIWVFETQRALSNFVNTGWEFGAKADASAMMQTSGGTFAGAISVSPDVYVYRLTDTGLAAELTVTGAKFFRDPDLN